MKKEEEKVEDISENWKRLTEAIPDIEAYILEDKIKVIRLKEGMKEPLDYDYYNKKVTLEELKQHKGNYGILVGYNNKKNGCSIAVADIDGITINKSDNIPMNRKEEIKQATKEYIFKSLKEAIPEALTVKTQSGGYHLYLWNEEEVEKVHNTSKASTFPSDFEIEELQGKSLRKSIEIFTKFESKQLVLPTSIITKIRKNKKIVELEEKREYTILSDVTKLSDIGTVNNIHEEVKEGLLANNYGYNEKGTSTSNRKRKIKKSRSSHRRKNSSDKKLKKLSELEVKKVVLLITDKYNLFSVIDGSKHEGTVALGGFFSYHITKSSSRKIAEGIVKKVGSLFEDSGAFKKTLLVSYERPIEEKAGLPTLIELIEDYDSDFNTVAFKTQLLELCTNEFEETKLNEKFYYNEKEYTMFLLKSKAEEYYLIKNFHEQGLNLEYHKAKHFILLRKNNKPLAKLRLKKTVEGVEATDKGLKRFETKLKDKTIILDFEEILEELDLLFTDSKEIKTLEQMIQEEEEKDPIEKLADNPRNIGALMEFSREYLEPTAKISVVYNPDKKKNEQYIFNNGYFEKLKEAVLHKFIEVQFGLRLPEDSVKTLLKSIPSNNTFNYNYFQFSNNIFFNGITGEFEKKEAGFLTDKKVGMIVNNKFKFVRRLTEEELAKDTKENGYSPLETLVYTIMSVPEDKEESIRRYEGFLEWLGYIFRPINTNKKIINLEGLGDDGKSTLLDVLIKVVPDYSVVVLPTELDKDFTEAMIGNKHLIVFDEAKTDEIVKHENYIKNASNGRSNRSSRQMYTEESIDNLKFGLIFILSNLPIAFNPSDEALMEREDIVHMFRRFKQNPDKSKGELEAKDVNSILDNDFRGFERIVNLGIIQYNKIRNKKNFELSTTITETQELILGNDIIKRFLALKTRYDKASVTTNETLTTAFLKWAKAEDIDLTEHFNYKNENTLKNYIKKQLGSKIKEHYRNIKEEDLVELNEDRKKQYSIRILTNSEVAERDSVKYCINEEEQVVNQAKYLTGTDKLVYNAVHELTEASINTLIKETDVPEVELIKTLANLETWDYIEEI